MGNFILSYSKIGGLVVYYLEYLSSHEADCLKDDQVAFIYRVWIDNTEGFSFGWVKGAILRRPDKYLHIWVTKFHLSVFPIKYWRIVNCKQNLAIKIVMGLICGLIKAREELLVQLWNTNLNILIKWQSLLLNKAAHFFLKG